MSFIVLKYNYIIICSISFIKSVSLIFDVVILNSVELNKLNISNPTLVESSVGKVRIRPLEDVGDFIKIERVE